MSDAPIDRRYTLDAFIDATVEREKREGLFELESERILDINLDGEVWIKAGAMIAYTGQVKFVREKLLDQGIGNLLKKAVAGEGASLTKATGQGSVFCADTGKKITVIQLQGESIFVNGNDLLAFEPGLHYDVKMMKKVGALMAGGLFNVRLEGTGLIAVTSHYEPLTLPVVPGAPVVTDPNATVMWSGGLSPSLKTDIQFKTLLGRGSGESIQMRFEGDGFVVVQPFEEVVMQAGKQ
jgi:uncharacterized protein (AIM24 family)